MRIFGTAASALLLTCCAASVIHAGFPDGNPIPKEQSDDPSYGYEETNPIKVGRGPENEERFLASLRGPAGQKLKVKRLGSCCSYKTPNALVGDNAPLDKYQIKYRGLKEPIIRYLSFYDYEQPRIPVGLTRAE